MLKSFAESFAKKRELRKTFAGSHVGSFWVKLTYFDKIVFHPEQSATVQAGGILD